MVEAGGYDSANATDQQRHRPDVLATCHTLYHRVVVQLLYGIMVHYTCRSADTQSAVYDRTELLTLLQTEQRKLRLRRCSKRPPCAGSGRNLGRGLPAGVLCAAALPGWRLLLGLLLLCLLTTAAAAAAAAAAVPALTPTGDQGAA